MAIVSKTRSINVVLCRCVQTILLAYCVLAVVPEARAGVRLVGIQLHLPIAVYRDLAFFQRYLDAATTSALRRERLRPGETPVIVFPEHVGTFLAWCDQSKVFYSARTLKQAVVICALSNPTLPLYHIVTSLSIGRWDIFETFLGFGNFLRWRAEWTWKAYLDSFSALARRHRAVVVAGSIAIPRPEEFRRRCAPIYGTSAIFGPDGGLLGVIRKLHPVLEEELFMAPAPPSELHPIKTPAGNIGVLICSDSWFADAYGLLRDSDMLAVPGIGEDGLQAFNVALRNFKNGVKNHPHSDGKKGKFWDLFFLEGVASRIRLTRARAAIMPFLTGPVIDLQSGGPGLAIRRLGEHLDIQVVPTEPGRSTSLNVSLPSR